MSTTTRCIRWSRRPKSAVSTWLSRLSMSTHRRQSSVTRNCRERDRQPTTIGVRGRDPRSLYDTVAVWIVNRLRPCRANYLCIINNREKLMAVEEVACPHCGEVTMSTVPQDAMIVATEPSSSFDSGYNEGDTVAACSECGKKFTAIFVVK